VKIKPFKTYNNNLIIAARACFNASNVWLFSPDLFIDRIRRDKFDELHVYAIDCEDPVLSGLLAVLNVAVKECKLPKDKVKIIAFQDPSVEWATFVKWNSFPLNDWIKTTIQQKDCVIDNTKFTKKFLALFNRYTPYRMRMAKYLHQNLSEYTMLSCRMGSGEISEQMQKIDYQFYKDEIDWLNHLPIILDYSSPTYQFDYCDMINSILHHKNEYLIEIVFESNIYDSHVFTEKTMRSFYTGKPFILFAGPGALTNLHKVGFKTFSPFINETYDQIENTEDRFRAIQTEIARLATLSIEELLALAAEYRSIFEYNQKLFFEKQSFWPNSHQPEYSKEIFEN
jgi:hypothetical protein